jgi:hypothetical protein
LLLARNPAAQDIEELGNLYTVQKITGSQDEVRVRCGFSERCKKNGVKKARKHRTSS